LNQDVVVLFAGLSLPFNLQIQPTFSFWKKGSQIKSICDRCNDPKEAYRGMKDISTAMDQGLNGSLAIDVWQYEQEKIS